VAESCSCQVLSIKAFSSLSKVTHWSTSMICLFAQITVDQC